MRDMSTLKRGRQLLLSLSQDLSKEELLAIPEGFNNNILWNLGHVLVVQQSLHYHLSGQAMAVSSELVAQCKRGSSPHDWTSPPDYQGITHLLTETADKLEQDYARGVFADYRPYRSASGFQMNSIEEALEFNLYHEGLHLGAILALKRFLI